MHNLWKKSTFYICILILTGGRLLTGKKEEVCHPAMRTIMQQAMQHLASIVVVADVPNRNIERAT